MKQQLKQIAAVYVFVEKGICAKIIKSEVRLTEDDWKGSDFDSSALKCFQVFVRYLSLPIIYFIMLPLEFIVYIFGALVYVFIAITSTIACVIGLL